MTGFKTEYFDMDWSLVGTFNFQIEDSADGLASVRPENVIAKAAINGKTISAFTIDMWQV